MKKRVKIPLIVGGSILGAILIVVIVLCAVTVYPMKSFMNYSVARIYDENGNWLPTGGEATEAGAQSTPKAAYKGKLDKALKKTSFSLMHATLEFVADYGPEFTSQKDEDGDTVRRKIKISEAKSECGAGEKAYKLELVFDSVKSVKVGKETVKYDTLLVDVKDTSGELKWITVYPYLSEYDDISNVEAEEYRVTPLKIRMNCSPLYIALGEIIAEYK